MARVSLSECEDLERLRSPRNLHSRRSDQQLLDDDRVPPFAVEAAMLFVNADFPEAERRAKFAARHILRKNPGQQLPPAASLRLVDQSAECCFAKSLAPAFAGYINREFADPIIAGP